MGRAPGRQATEMGSGGPCVCLSLQTPRRSHSPGEASRATLRVQVSLAPSSLLPGGGHVIIPITQMRKLRLRGGERLTRVTQPVS